MRLIGINRPISGKQRVWEGKYGRKGHLISGKKQKVLSLIVSALDKKGLPGLKTSFFRNFDPLTPLIDPLSYACEALSFSCITSQLINPMPVSSAAASISKVLVWTDELYFAPSADAVPSRK